VTCDPCSFVLDVDVLAARVKHAAFQPLFFSFASLSLGLKSVYHLTGLVQRFCLAITAHQQHHPRCDLFWATCYTCLGRPVQRASPVVPPSCFLYFMLHIAASLASALLCFSSFQLGSQIQGLLLDQVSLTLPRIQAHKGTVNLAHR